MSLLLLLRSGGSTPPIVEVPWRWNGLLLSLHNPYDASGTAPYLPNGLALSVTVKSRQTATSAVRSGVTSTQTVKTGSTITLTIKSGQKDAVVL